VYPAQFLRSGIFLIASPNIGTMIKVNQIDKSFTDVATLSSLIFMNFGVCR